MRPSLVTGSEQQNQAPPPYFAENKALEHSLDHALAMEDSKVPAYAQPGYAYHHQATHNINGKNNELLIMGIKDFSVSFKILVKNGLTDSSRTFGRIFYISARISQMSSFWKNKLIDRILAQEMMASFFKLC